MIAAARLPARKLPANNQFLRLCQDGHNRKNFLFAGSDAGGDRAAAIYSLVGSAKLNGLDPEAYLRFVIERIADYQTSKLDELLPWNVAAQITKTNDQAATA